MLSGRAGSRAPNTVSTDMELHHDIAGLRRSVATARQQGHSIAVVPTMGHLHEGHLTLVREALSRGSFVVCTVFVNPMQFGRNEDLDSYPRTLEDDRRNLEAAGCHCLFAPSVREIYPHGLDVHTRVSVPGLSEGHCGAGRPGHFDGVATVVCKLFNIVLPDIAIFGQKDYQQLQVIRAMAADLCFPVRIIGIPTQRAASGLALSSRNSYLSSEQRDTAAAIYRILRQTADLLKDDGTVDYRQREQNALDQLREAGLEPEYFSICAADTLKPASPEDRELVILAAARTGGTRLIDNISVTL